MKRRKQILAAVLAAITLSQGMVAFANTVTNEPKPGTDEHTTISIVETATDLSQTSFEVPLYVTAAAVSNSDTLLCPEGYDITNSAQVGGTNIGVVSIKVERLTGAKWNIVKDTIDTNKDVILSIGGQKLPEVNKNTTTAKIDLLKSTEDTAFFDNTTSKLRKIEPQKTLSQAKTNIGKNDPGYKGLEIKGQIERTTRNEAATAAQFKVIYTVAPLDANGDPIGKTYVGDVKSEAGLQ